MPIVCQNNGTDVNGCPLRWGCSAEVHEVLYLAGALWSWSLCTCSFDQAVVLGFSAASQNCLAFFTHTGVEDAPSWEAGGWHQRHA